MKPETIRKICFILSPLVVVGVICTALPAPAARAAAPCCGITAIDFKTGMVTAKETATGRSFWFQVKDAALLKSLKVGQKISADLKAMTVTLPAAWPGAKPVQVRILRAEPLGHPAEPVGQPQATGGPVITAKPGGVKSASINYSVLGSYMQPLNPSALLPDLVPFSPPAIATCNWSEYQGETCESKCPPREQSIPLGTKNISQRPLSGPVRVKVLEHPSGNVVRDWAVTDVPGNGFRATGSIIKTVVFCHEGTSVSTTGPPPNYKLVVETNATEIDKNNNTKLVYIGPATNTRLGP